MGRQNGMPKYVTMILSIIIVIDKGPAIPGPGHRLIVIMTVTASTTRVRNMIDLASMKNMKRHRSRRRCLLQKHSGIDGLCLCGSWHSGCVPLI